MSADSNKLIDGCIPSGKPCPFLNECRAKVTQCPTPERLYTHAFSCALARAFEMIKCPHD